MEIRIDRSLVAPETQIYFDTYANKVVFSKGSPKEGQIRMATISKKGLGTFLSIETTSPQISPEAITSLVHWFCGDKMGKNGNQRQA